MSYIRGSGWSVWSGDSGMGGVLAPASRVGPTQTLNSISPDFLGFLRAKTDKKIYSKRCIRRDHPRFRDLDGPGRLS